MNKKVKRKISDCFLNQTINIFLITVFVIIAVIQLYQMNIDFVITNFNTFYEFIKSNDFLIDIILFMIPIIVSIINFLIKKFNNKTNAHMLFKENKKTYTFPGIVTNKMIKKNKVIFIKDLQIDSKHNKPLILDRYQQCKNLALEIENLSKKIEPHKLNCLFLTGMSGSGKSILLNNFLPKELNTSVTLIHDNYNDGNLIYNKIMEKQNQIIIMDQFENSLSYQSFYSYIKKIVNDIEKPIIFIFSFPQDFLYLIHKNLTELFNKDIKENPNFINSSIYFISNDDYDINQLKILINRFTQEDYQNINNCLEECKKKALSNSSFKSIVKEELYSPSLIFLCSILSRIEVGISPLVEFSILSYIYEIFEQEISANLTKYIDNIDNVIDLYLNNWVSQFPHPETGKMILYLLSDRKIYTIDDFKFITFEPPEYFTNTKNNKFNIIEVICNNTFLSIKKNYNGFNKGFSSIHDYIGLKLNEYCFRNLSNELRQNVDYYRKIMTKSLDNKRPTAFSNEKNEIQNRYNRFYKKQTKYFINIFIILMAITTLLINFNLYNVYTYIKDDYIYLWLSIGCCVSVYYVYNTIMQSTSILPYKHYVVMLITGAVIVPLCYIYPNLYGIFMGIEVVIIGATQFCINFKTVYEAKEHFTHTGILYIVFGITIIVFGFLYIFYPNISFHLFFITYVLGANYGHIKYSYTINRIGKINTIRL